MSEETRQSIIDEEHVKLLSLGYIVSACVSLFFSLFGLFYVFMGVMMRTAFSHIPEAAAKANQPPPVFFLWFLGGMGVAIFTFMVVVAALKFRTAWCLKHRKSRTFCMVIAGISCLEIPYGTILGIFTFIVLGRESVVRLFASRGLAAPFVQS
jgi:hypothetical protein